MKLAQMSLISSPHSLGTTRKAAGSAEAFERIDREYVMSLDPPIVRDADRSISDMF